MFVSVAGVKVVNTLYWFAAALIPLWLVETQREGPLLVGGVGGQPILLLCTLAGAGANLWFMSRLSRLHPGARLSLRMLSLGASSFAIGGVCAGANVLLPYLAGRLGLDLAVPPVPPAAELERLLFSLPLWIAAGAAVGSLWLGFFSDRTEELPRLFCPACGEDTPHWRRSECRRSDQAGRVRDGEGVFVCDRCGGERGGG